MTTASLVRVQVTTHRRRLDVSLPIEVALWEFLPEVLRGVGWTYDPSRTVLVTAAGRRLDPGRGLIGQDVVDGDVLTVARHEEHRPAVLHDDLVEAVHERSREVLPCWDPAATARAGAAVPLVIVALVLLVLGTAPVPDGTAAVTGAATLVVLGVAAYVARQGGPAWASVVAGWLAVVCAGVTGRSTAALAGLPPTEVAATTVLAAGAVGLCALLLAGPRWPLHVPPLIVVATWTGAGAVSSALAVPLGEVLLVLLASGSLVATAVPALTVGATVTRGQAVSGDGIDVARLDSDIVVAHRLVLALQWAGSALSLAAVPFVVVSGAPATGALLVIHLVRLLRLRHQRSSTVVASGLVSLGLATAWLLAQVVLVRPEWLPAALVLLLLVAVLAALAVTVSARDASGAWWGWLGDTCETVLVAALPVTVTLALWWDRWSAW